MRGDPPVLVVDDELAIRRLVCRALARGGFETVEAGSAGEGLRIAASASPELVLLDLGLPDRDGLELIQPLVDRNCAVLVLTARDAVAEKVAALDLGADDYVTKPFDTEELLARVRTCLRHRYAAFGLKQRVRVKDVAIDLNAHLVHRAEEEVHLAPKEFAVLAELARNAGKVVTHSQLLNRVWGSAHENDVEYLRVAVRSIRLKLEADPAHPTLIRNEPGIGYRLMDDSNGEASGVR